MNNLQQQKFQFLRFSEARPNEDRYSVDVWDTDKIFLNLKPLEINALYLDLGLDVGESVVLASLFSISGQKFIPDLHFIYKITEVNGKQYFVFFFGNNVITDCNSFYFSFTTSKRILYSNIFTITNQHSHLKRTTLLTFQHSENFYNANYADNSNMPQQVRVPMWFSHEFTETEAEKFNDSYQLENRYRSGKVKRLFFETWEVLMNDVNYNPFSVALDSDHIYFDKTYFNVKPFDRERDGENKGFIVSKVEAQRVPGKIFDDSVFGEFFDIKADDITYNFEYHHAPENTPLAGEFFLVNLLFINYTNFFGVVYDCALRAKITEIPVKGKLFSQATGQFINVGDEVSYCDKDDLVYLPNGFDNNLGIYGDFTVTFKYRIIDHLGNQGANVMTQTINMTDLSEVIPIILSVTAVWADGTDTDKTGEADGITMRANSETHDINCEPVQFIWQRETNGNWNNIDVGNADTTAALFVGVNRFRLKFVDNCGHEAISNILQYTKTQTLPPLKQYWYKALHPEGHQGSDYVVYQDTNGNQQTFVLQRAYSDEYGFHPAPCTAIWARKIIATYGVDVCEP